MPRRGARMGERQRENRRQDAARLSRRHLSAVPDPHRPQVYERFVKPAIDRLVGVLFSIVTAPVVAVCALLIRRTMGKPAIFRQDRVGRGGAIFTVYKLRTMNADRRSGHAPIEHDERRRTHKSEADPRHTALGQRLRRWSLDEIPQFWNLALGDMSLVGPRPELVEVVGRYEPWQHRRHEVKPGLTGLWQIRARGEIPMHEATHLDVEYVDTVSLRRDLRILLATPAAMLGRRRGA